MKYFFDNNLSPKYARMLSALDHEVIHLTDAFPRNAKDAEWLPWVGEEGYVLVTVDWNILARAHEREIYAAKQVTGVFLPKKFLSYELHQQASKLALWWPAIDDAARAAHRGTTLEVRTNGKVSRR